MYVSNHSLKCRHLHLYQSPQWEWPTEIQGHHSKEQQLCACENNLTRLGQLVVEGRKYKSGVLG